MRAIVSICLLFLATLGVCAADSGKLSTESLSAKALLEELLAKRYEADLATRVSRESFHVGAQLELVAITKKPDVVDPEPLSDLSLGNLDPEELIKRYTNTTDNQTILSFLEKYKIRKVSVLVGLRDNLPEETKGEVEKWLSERVKSEFGGAGKSLVSMIRSPVKEPGKQESFLQKLEKLQDLAGQMVLAAAIILSLFLWKFLTNPASPTTGDTAGAMNVNLNQKQDDASSSAGGKSPELIAREKLEEAESLQKINEITQKIREVVPRLSVDFERLVISWCQMGKEGHTKLACFAEAVGRDVGRLPIPIDAIPEITKVFAQMATLPLKEKRTLLDLAYWDMLSVLNLGADSVNQPFSYLGAVSSQRLQQVLVTQNPRLQSIVSFYLPPELRKKYVQGLDSEKKLALLKSAGELYEVPAKEVRESENLLKPEFKSASNAEIISLAQNVARLCETLTPVEELSLLSVCQGPAFDQFKISTPTIAFLHEWNDRALGLILDQANADEIACYLRFRPEVRDQFLALCPPLTATMVRDELERNDTTSETTKNELLSLLKDRVVELVQSKAVDLEEIFANGTNDTQVSEAA